MSRTTSVKRREFVVPKRKLSDEERCVLLASLARGRKIPVPFDRSPRRSQSQNTQVAEEWLGRIASLHELYERFMRGDIAIQFVADEVMELNPDTMELLEAQERPQ